jgi:periplasmic copper chaperone A
MKRTFLKVALGALALGTGWMEAQTMKVQTMNMSGMQMSTPASAKVSPAVKALKLVQGWVSAAPPGAEELSAYIELRNPGSGVVTLIGLSTSVSGQAMLMSTGTDTGGRGTMQMASSMKILPGSSLKILPGHGHLMLRALKRQPQPGEQVAVTLRFSDGSAWPLKLPVRKFP